MSKQKFKVGDRIVSNGQSAHIKGIYADGILTTRGFRTTEEMEFWKVEPLPHYKTWSIRLSLKDYETCVQHFGNPSAAVRWAISQKEGKR